MKPASFTSGGSMGSKLPVGLRSPSRHAEESPAPRVLVVDDDRLLRWAIAETLGARGYGVIEAADADSATRAFLAGLDTTDLVLLDLWLPDCRDLRILSFMRRLRPAIPVVLMTAHGTTAIAEEAARLGAVVADKPFDLTELARLVERVLLIPRH